MLSKEELSEVISYCQQHGCSYKDRLTELSIAEWKFYDSKYRYAIQERKIKESGQWMEDVLRQMPYYERDGKDLTELLPREWAKTHQPES